MGDANIGIGDRVGRILTGPGVLISLETRSCLIIFSEIEPTGVAVGGDEGPTPQDIRMKLVTRHKKINLKGILFS